MGLYLLYNFCTKTKYVLKMCTKNGFLYKIFFMYKICTKNCCIEKVVSVNKLNKKWIGIRVPSFFYFHMKFSMLFLNIRLFMMYAPFCLHSSIFFFNISVILVLNHINEDANLIGIFN